VHDTARSWILADCQGILPLAKAFFPLMQLASNIVARDYDHAWQIAKQTFIYPAERFGLDCEAAEREAFARISFDEAAA
jgi:chaperone required for assembly of F1-ATPase